MIKFTCGWGGAEAGEGAEGGGAADRLCEIEGAEGGEGADILSARVASDAVGIDRALDIDGIADDFDFFFFK